MPAWSWQRFKCQASSLRRLAEGGHLPPPRQDSDSIPAILSPGRVYIHGPQGEMVELSPDDPRYQAHRRYWERQLESNIQHKKRRGLVRRLLRR